MDRMDDLIAFLRARLDEDEKTAHRAHGDLFSVLGQVEYYDGAAEMDEQHITRHNPKRVLAEVEAKRQVLIEHQPWRPRWCSTCDVPGDYQGREHGCTTVRLLALPYADHPDYRDAWRP